MLRHAYTVALVLVLVGTQAMAQNPQPTSPANPTLPIAPPNSPTPPPERIVLPNADMSGRLSQQKGAIKPPNVDPGMTVTPPSNSASKTPVIPPPGAPGGNASVVPK